jgi:hypothetical protein
LTAATDDTIRLLRAIRPARAANQMSRRGLMQRKDARESRLFDGRVE